MEKLRADAIDHVSMIVLSVLKSLRRHTDIAVRFNPLKEKHFRLLKNAHEIIEDSEVENVAAMLREAENGLTPNIVELYFRKTDFAYIYYAKTKKWCFIWPTLDELREYHLNLPVDEQDLEYLSFLSSDVLRTLREKWTDQILREGKLNY